MGMALLDILKNVLVYFVIGDQLIIGVYIPKISAYSN